MADQAVKDEKTKAEAPVEATGRKPKKKKSMPTNCAQSNKRIHRKDWYYRNGKFFANKKAFTLYVAQEAAAKASAPAATSEA